MVRFIIMRKYSGIDLYSTFTFHYGQIYYIQLNARRYDEIEIYIPLWLDLLFKNGGIKEGIMQIFTFHYGQIYYALKQNCKLRACGFTFHYGQIYYLCSQVARLLLSSYLHSTMVRFIIFKFVRSGMIESEFTFHYGQIYYINIIIFYLPRIFIYIPLWLDLLLWLSTLLFRQLRYLHSTMVRFIILFHNFIF